MLRVNARAIRFSPARQSGVIADAVFLCFSLSLIAQNIAGAILGLVQGAQGAVIPRAKVTALNQEENAMTATALTNRDGVFVFNPLLEDGNLYHHGAGSPRVVQFGAKIYF